MPHVVGDDAFHVRRADPAHRLIIRRVVRRVGRAQDKLLRVGVDFRVELVTKVRG